MAKIYGLFGTMSGKVADVVMAVRNGQQVVRRYQPIISDRKSEAQVAARARLKLMSQLSAVMSPVIAIPRDGVVSSRNQFVALNYGASKYTEGNADINMADVKLTRSAIGLPNIAATRATDGSSITVGLSTPAVELDVSRIVYAAFVRGGDNTLYLHASAIADEAGDNNQWEVQMPYRVAELFVYAYGVRDNNDAARTTFSQLALVSAQEVARVVTERILTERDISLTETVYYNLPRRVEAVTGASAVSTGVIDEVVKSKKSSK